MKTWLQIATVLMIFTSCEKVIEVPLDEADIEYVVEAVLKDRDSISYVKLSTTSTVYTESNFPKVSGASVVVSNSAGDNYVFNEDPGTAGLYWNDDFKVEENLTYNLSIEIDGVHISGEASSRSKPSIDSVTYTLESFGFQGENFETYLVAYHSVDKAGEQNHYRLRIWINQDEVGFFYLGDDEFIDGQYYEAQFFGSSPELGDSIYIEMLEMDEVNYDYQIGLSNQDDNSMFAAAPANPRTNIEGALGFLGVFMTDTASLIVE